MFHFSKKIKVATHFKEENRDCKLIFQIFFFDDVKLN